MAQSRDEYDRDGVSDIQMNGDGGPVRLIVDTNSLERTAKTLGSSPVWEKIWVSVDNFEFPEIGWWDLTVALTTDFLESVNALLQGRADRSVVRFFDGPHQVEISAGDAGWNIDLRSSNVLVFHLEDVELASFQDSVIRAAKSLDNRCEKEGWIDSDVARMRRAFNR